MARLLVLMDYYIPGFRGGGPTTSVAHLVEWLGKEMEFSIVARDRDLGKSEPYLGIQRGRWQTVNGARVLYVHPRGFWLPRFLSLLRKEPYDLLYLQGFFTSPTISALLVRRLGLIPARPVIVAPRGDFAPAGLALKRRKKRMYLWVAKRFGLYRGVTWQATAERERTEILEGFCKTAEAVGSRIVIAPNLPPRAQRWPMLATRQPKTPGAARIIFLSRIARKKGLDLALRILARVEGRVEFDIYGPVEESGYWRKCQVLMEALPRGVRAHYRGAVRPEAVLQTFAAHHLFLFPSRGENFGHVILEALTAGCPVLTADTTPWMELTDSQAGWALPLSDLSCFARTVENVVAMDAAEFDGLTSRAREYGLRISTDQGRVEANRRMFRETMRRSG